VKSHDHAEMQRVASKIANDPPFRWGAASMLINTPTTTHCRAWYLSRRRTHLRLTHPSLADRLYPLRRRSRSPSRHPPPTSLRPTPCGGNLTTQSFSSSASASRCLPRTQTRPGKTCTRMKAWCWGCYAVWCRSVGVGQVQVHLHSSVSAVATSEPNPNADTRNAL